MEEKQVLKRKPMLAAAAVLLLMAALALIVRMNTKTEAQTANVSTVEIEGVKSRMGSLNSGVASILTPAYTTESAQVLGTQAVEEESTYELVMVNVSNTLNVREEPSEDALVVGKMYKDCGGIVLERRDGWTKLESGNLTGWAKDEYLLFGDEAEALADKVGYPVAVVTTNALRVREEASTDAGVLGYAAQNEELTVVGEVDSDWLIVEYGSSLGYILREYVSEEYEVDNGETLDDITEREMKEAADKKKLVTYYGSMSASDYERLLLAALIYCEAGGESYEGKLAVGAVVCNRVRSSGYPNTLQGVIYASGQFTPAKSGRLDQVMVSGNIPQSCYDAAEEALAGYTNVGSAVRFRANNGTIEGVVIGNHVFY
ncbi:MAG: cell wall hydrolase [Lachnospiraceae bacterium]|nr:cell wall hydrolase [Lachnospiraceae bacterium]